MRRVAMLLCWFALSAQQVNRLTHEKGVALGARLAADMRERVRPLENKLVQHYVRDVAASLTSELPSGTAPPFEFTVFKDTEIERFNVTHEPAAFPGGYMFIPTSLLLAARDEAEFAGMLARSIVRVARGLWPRGQGWDSVVFLGAPVSVSLPPRVAEKNREVELECDRYAVPLMATAGYDPRALARYIDRVQPPGMAPSELPPREERLQALERALNGVTIGGQAKHRDFAAIRQQVREAVYPPQRPTPPAGTPDTEALRSGTPLFG